MELRVKREYMNTREVVIEFLIQNQPFMKDKLFHLNDTKNRLLLEESPAFREEIKDQYNARILQWIAFYTSEALAIPAEYVIIELERIEMDEFLKV